MNKEVQYCYHCGVPATSIEHVPPKCMFPEKKDSLGYDFRKNLFTVPSCDMHNMSKSMDDEYLMICIACSTDANYAGYFHYRTKVMRALKRKHKAFLERIFGNAEHIYVNDGKGNMIPALKAKLDLKRMRRCLESISYGLYFAEYNQPFRGKVIAIPDFTIPESKNQAEFIKLLKYSFEQDKTKRQQQGDNSDIFYYQFAGPDQNGMYSLKMTFYENINVYVGLRPEGVPVPYNLVNDLANNGIKTIISFGDKTVEFN